MGSAVTDATFDAEVPRIWLAVIPEGAGTVNSETGILPGLIFLLAVLRRFWARRDEALGSGIDPAGSTAKRPKVLDANAGRRTLFKRRGKVGGSRVLGWCGSRCVLQRRWPGWWTGPGGLSVIPSLPSVLGWFGPVVGSGHPGVPGVAVIPLPSMARGDWPPGTPRRPGCSLRIAN